MDKKAPWQLELINAITDPNVLLDLLELDPMLLAGAKEGAKLFPLKVTRSFVQRMKKGDANDPLLLQVLPLHEETLTVEGFVETPLQEASANPIPGLLHKYPGRVLLLPTSACGIHCRYCFRRYFSYESNKPGTAGWKNALDYIAQDPSIHEVILSGGDPLVMNDYALHDLSEKLSAIPHLKRLRLHSRLPIVLPERMTETCLEWFRTLTLKPILVLHCNHPNEINAAVKQAMKQCTAAGVTLLNQAVLLKNINDTADTQVALSEALFDAGILPYYLHLLDKVKGAAHFDLELKKALAMHAEIKTRLPGFLVPRLVREEPGALSKSVFENG